MKKWKSGMMEDVKWKTEEQKGTMEECNDGIRGWHNAHDVLSTVFVLFLAPCTVYREPL